MSPQWLIYLNTWLYYLREKPLGADACWRKCITQGGFKLRFYSMDLLPVLSLSLFPLPLLPKCG